MNPWLLSIPLAYLLGSIPFGYLLVRFFRNQDIRAIGSGNIGATNVARSGAKGLGLATLLLDLGKAFARRQPRPAPRPRQSRTSPSSAAVAAILGHVFPVWLGFRGGKGVASALGVFLALAGRWRALRSSASSCVVVALTRYVSLASILGRSPFPLFGLYLRPAAHPVVIAGLSSSPSSSSLKHHANIRRLLAGTESRFGRPERQGDRMSRIAILGAGAWGTALAISLARRGGHELILWAHSARARRAAQRHRRKPSLPPRLHPARDIHVTSDLPAPSSKPTSSSASRPRSICARSSPTSPRCSPATRSSSPPARASRRTPSCA